MSQFGGEGSIDIDAARKQCFELAADAERYPEWHPVIQSVEVLDRDAEGRTATARLVVDASVSVVTVEVEFAYEPPGIVELRRRSGDLKEMWTRFDLAELDAEQTRLEYSTGLDPGRMLSMMARGPVLDKVRRKLVDDALTAFKAAAEAG
jgi:ribosome-associated toxin RatA of RatAB toxin-antitoxin module